MIPCYVSGKGMHASEVTWSFKTSVIQVLEETGLGFDTRFQYYRQQFPDMPVEQLARMICDPMEYYDKDWPSYRDTHKQSMSREEMATRFMLERDEKFKQQAQLAIYCFDEAGFGSGINVMEFLSARKPILGFLRSSTKSNSLNISNVLQLKAKYPNLIHIMEYETLEDITSNVVQWLKEVKLTMQQQQIQQQ